MNLAQRIELWPLDRLKPYDRNARTHSDDQVAKIAASMTEFGFTNPILVDSAEGIIAGHGRLMAAKSLGLSEVPVIVLDHLTDAQRRAYILADNRLALDAGWDEDMLAEELAGLRDDGFDLAMTGFTDDELADLLEDNVEHIEPQGDPDEAPAVEKFAVTVEGDVWLLGKHRLMCGDSTSIDAVERLMDGSAVDMVYTDPPYGISVVGKNGKICGDNLAKNGVYAPIAGDDSIDVAIEAIQVIKTINPSVQVIWGGNYYGLSGLMCRSDQ